VAKGPPRPRLHSLQHSFAVHSLLRFVALRYPEHAELKQRVLAIPPKRCDRKEVSFVFPDESMLATPDRNRWAGRRDHALLLMLIQTGLRVSELAALRRNDVELGPGPHLRCLGKGREERARPLTTQTVGFRRFEPRRLGRARTRSRPRGRGVSSSSFGDVPHRHSGAPTPFTAGDRMAQRWTQTVPSPLDTETR
jgi:integrase